MLGDSTEVLGDSIAGGFLAMSFLLIKTNVVGRLLASGAAKLSYSSSSSGFLGAKVMKEKMAPMVKPTVNIPQYKSILTTDN